MPGGVFPLVVAAFFLAAPRLAADDAAGRLWQDFLVKYASNSLEPLAPEVLDQKAREQLVKGSGMRFRGWKADSQASLPDLATAMSEADPAKSAFERVEDSLAALLPTIDRYGGYDRAADVARLREVFRQNTGSIHMKLDEREDIVRCYPLEGGPADKSGIRSGARLLHVDETSVEKKSLAQLKLAFAGPAGSTVRVSVLQPYGKTEIISVVRSGDPIPVVSVVESPLGVTLRIRSFERGVASQVRAIAATHRDAKRLTIDLRGNVGGYWDEVVKVESLFFPEGTLLGKLTTRQGTERQLDGNGVELNPGAIRFLTDGMTASAAEFLIAALREGLPGKVTVFGAKTYGKSHTVVLESLSGGGQMIVTDSLLSTAGGTHWDGKGILPDGAGGK